MRDFSALIRNRAFRVLQHIYSITSPFESIPMNELETNNLLHLKVDHVKFLLSYSPNFSL